MNQQFFRLLRLFFIFLDLLMLNVSFALDKFIYSGKISASLAGHYTSLWMAFNIAWMIAIWSSNVYSQSNISSFETFSHKSLRAYVYFLALVMLYIFIFKQQSISRLFIMTVLLSIGLVILVNRLLYLVAGQFIRKRDYLTRKVIIVGYNDVSKRLAQQLEEDVLNTKIIGYCENEQNVHELSNYPIVGGLNNIIEVSKHYEANEIFSTIAPDGNEGIYQLMQKADQACIRFKLVPNFNLFTRLPMHVDYFGSIPVLSLRKEPLDDIANRIRKRIYDLVISSLVILFILSWMIPLMSLLIWLESRGPVFFVQMRSGKDNRPFGCIKFRSMKINKDANILQATKGDERITRIGKFLRKTSLDEFPQFLNVFIGDMSVVGPRPHMLKHTNDYSAMINKYMVRHFAKPGITGWAQINGFRGET
ncbi:MAG TPA: exopolysaccharide biosynthesis polyprenyl glycosylphosphotransferase, partial [Chitinophagaceae bacterium]|nr:exopolysaccharide biosynthesis polyprenyl glycosylphosphotransferase [Chitinophagaceae bacterium]